MELKKQNLNMGSFRGRSTCASPLTCDSYLPAPSLIPSDAIFVAGHNVVLLLKK